MISNGVLSRTSRAWLGFYRYGIYPRSCWGFREDRRRDRTMGRSITIHGARMPYAARAFASFAFDRTGTTRMPVCIAVRPAETCSARNWRPVGFSRSAISTQKFPNSFPRVGDGLYVIAPAFLVRRTNATLRRRWLRRVSDMDWRWIHPRLQGGILSATFFGRASSSRCRCRSCPNCISQEDEEFEADASNSHGQFRRINLVILDG